MKFSGGEAVVRSLVDNAVRTVYGLPGSHVLDIYNYLRYEKRIDHILVMHELNSAFMADAHGRLTGKPGVCISTGGPGATNAVTGIAQAYTEASPVVQITGHCGSNKKIQPSHSVDDTDFQLKIYEPLTKWSTRVGKIEDIQATLKKAFAVATSDRPGPVHVEIPEDVLVSSKEVSEWKTYSEPRSTQSADIATSVKGVAEILESAINPIIVVGKGVLREFCSADVVDLARCLGAPILTLPSSISAIPYQCPLYLGYDLPESGNRWMVHPSIRSVIRKADIILTLGFDIGERHAYFAEKSKKIIHIHRDRVIINSEEVNEQNSGSLTDLQVNIKDFIILSMKEVKRRHISVKNLERELSRIKRQIRKDIARSIKWGNKPVHPGETSMELARMLADDAIVALDVGNNAEWMKICHRAKRSNTVLTPGRYGSMGFSLPAAIAAKINFPKKQVVAVTGDGGFLMSYMDFPTLVKYKLGILVIIESNRSYGMIWHTQRKRYGGNTFATEIEDPDFAEYARAFGVVGMKVTDPADLKIVLEKALNERGPVLVDIDTEHKFPLYIPTRTMRFLRKMKYSLK